MTLKSLQLLVIADSHGNSLLGSQPLETLRSAVFSLGHGHTDFRSVVREKPRWAGAAVLCLKKYFAGYSEGRLVV